MNDNESAKNDNKSEKNSVHVNTDEDYIIRGTAACGMIRAFAATTKNLVQEASSIHHTSPVATAALGRLLTAAAMMGSMLKGEGDLVTIMVQGDGPLKNITVTGDSKSRVKGFVTNPDIWIPEKYQGKLDVGKAVGSGVLTVVRDQESGEPYSSQVELQTGEIGDDLTYYFAVSEQVPSSVGLGVLIDRDCSVKRAGGFIIQLMPGCDDETVMKLEDNLKKVTSVTSMLEQGMTPEDILNKVLSGMNPDVMARQKAEYYCNCSRERVEKVLLSIGKKDLQEMTDEGKPAELVCSFCGKKYTFSTGDMKLMLAAQETAGRRTAERS